MGFEWSPAKYKRNVARHGLAFEEAIEIFGAAYLERSNNRRIISARRAEPGESAAYYEVMYGSN